MRRDLIVFDFDGTLADTFAVFVEAFDVLAERHRFQRFDHGCSAHLRTLDARGVLAHHEVPLWKLPQLSYEMRWLMEQTIDKARLFPGILAALEQLKQRGALLALLTSNSRKNIERVMGGRGVELFDRVECGASIFGKRVPLQRILKATRVARADAILIGDEIRDSKAAKQCQIAFGAVEWGYNDLESLMAAGAEIVFMEAAELGLLRDDSGATAEAVPARGGRAWSRGGG